MGLAIAKKVYKHAERPLELFEVFYISRDLNNLNKLSMHLIS